MSKTNQYFFGPFVCYCLDHIPTTVGVIVVIIGFILCKLLH